MRLRVDAPGPPSPKRLIRCHHVLMQTSRVPIEIDSELVARAEQAGAPTGRSATAVVEDAVRAFLGADVIDTVRARNCGADPEEIARLGRSELYALRREQAQAAP